MSCCPCPSPCCPGPIVIKVTPQSQGQCGGGCGSFTLPPIKICCTEGCGQSGGGNCCPPKGGCCQPNCCPQNCCQPNCCPQNCCPPKPNCPPSCGGGGNNCCQSCGGSGNNGCCQSCGGSGCCCPPRGCPCPPATCQPTCKCPDPWPPCPGCPEKKKDSCCVPPKICGCPPRAISEGTPDPFCCQPCCNPCPCCCPAPSAVPYLPNTHGPCCGNNDNGKGSHNHRELRWPQCNFMKPCIDTRVYRDGEAMVISYAGHIPGEQFIHGRNLPTTTTFAKRRLCTFTPYEFVDPDGCCSNSPQ